MNHICKNMDWVNAGSEHKNIPAGIMDMLYELERHIQSDKNKRDSTKSSDSSSGDETLKRKHIQAMYKFRVELSQLITTISNTFINLPADEIDIWFQHALYAIADITEADHISVLLFHDDDDYDYYSWSHQSQLSKDQLYKDSCESILKLWKSKLEQSKYVYLKRSEHSRSKQYEILFLEQFEIQSLLLIPINYNRTLMGILQLTSSTQEKRWADNIIPQIKLMGEIFLHAYKRKCTENELIIHRKKLEKEIIERKNAERSLFDKNEALKKSNEALKQTQEALIQQKKMVAIGQLAAGIAHEINNPTGYILCNLGSLERYNKKIKQCFTELNQYINQEDQIDIANDPGIQNKYQAIKKNHNIDFIIDDLELIILDSKEGLGKISRIVNSLSIFSHAHETEAQLCDINSCLQNTLAIAKNEIKQKAEVICHFDQLPKIMVNTQELHQVFLSIIINAVQAIKDEGIITIKTWLDENLICILCEDNGAGIPQSIMNRVYEPFFTTKKVGMGTGLGLTVSYEIIKSHGGHIKIFSEENKGTKVLISLPVSNQMVSGNTRFHQVDNQLTLTQGK